MYRVRSKLDFLFAHASVPGSNVTKQYVFVIHESSYQLFVPGKLLKPSLMFLSKAGAYPSLPYLSVAPLLVSLLHLPTNIDWNKN
jgi:hypothetical protein